MTRKFITSALPYVNNQPHLGNIVGSVLGSDVYNRFSKKSGDETILICGTDEYGTATEMEAMKQKVHPKEIVEKNRVLHKQVYDWMNCDFDVFGKTSCSEHQKIVQKMFKKCYENGYFEEKNVDQFYCKTCDQFLADRYVEGICNLCGYDNARGDQCDKCGRCLRTQDISSPKCAICTSEPEIKSSKHLFLRLDLLQEKIKNSMDSKKGQWTQVAINIYNEWLEKELISRCMTRTLKYNWGVPVPLEGFEDKVFYVWFDAVIGYLTFLSQIKEDWEEWLKDATFVQFMAKDNVFFHAFIFPGILLAADPNAKTVDIINSTEYLTFNKEKFSKSRKIGIFGLDLVNKDLGRSCLWRFYLIKRRPESKDSDFDIEDFINVANSDLLNNIGNLCQRILKYLAKNCDGKINIDSIDEIDQAFVDEINIQYNEYLKCMEKISLRDGLAKAVEISSIMNKFIQNLQDRKERLKNGFQIGYSAIVFLAHLLEPFIPITSEKMFSMCNTTSGLFPKSFEIIKEAKISADIKVLFEPFTKEQLENLRSYIPRNQNLESDKNITNKVNNMTI